MAYAEGTSVPVEKTVGEICGLIKKAGAVRIGQMDDPDAFAIQFFMRERMLRFRVAMPTLEQMPTTDGRGSYATKEWRVKRRDQAQRQRARALLLVIKAKLESIESGVETFDEAFLANIVMSDGATVFERVNAPIQLEYGSGKSMPMLLEGPRP